MILPYFTYEQYKEFYYNNGRTIDQMNKPRNRLNESQLESKYEKYLKKYRKQQDRLEEQIQKQFEKSFNIDEKWEEVKKRVYERDKDCQLWVRLTKGETDWLVNQNGFFLLETVDPAHVFGKGAYPHLKYDEDNIVLLSRLFHSRLDHFYDPLTGSSIDKETQERWWKLIVGEERYNRLEEKARNGKK